MKRLAEVKDSLDIEVKQNFIDPLQNLCDKDLKEIQVNATPRGFLSSSSPCSPGSWAVGALQCWEPGAGRNSLHSLCFLPPDSLVFPPCSALLLLLLSSPKGWMQVGMVLHLPSLMEGAVGICPNTPSGLAELGS